MIKGIDVSSHNAGFNYASAKAQGFEYCYIKATEGKSYINPEMDAQYTMAKKNGFKVGFYHYCNDNSSAEIQADFFNSVIKKYDQDLMPCLDIETNMSNPTDFTERFIQRLGGKDRAIIYTGLYYYRQYINTNGYKIWVAAYGQSKPSMRDNNMVGWQYTDSGINGRTDLSEWYGDILIKKETPTDQRTETDTISNGIVTASVLNVRDGAGMNYPVIGQLTKGTNVRISSLYSTTSWYSIYYGQHGGFVSKQYVSLSNNNSNNSESSGIIQIEITANALNVRENPTTNSAILGVVYKTHFMRANLLYSTEDWYSVYYGEHGGFVAKKYCRVI